MADYTVKLTLTADGKVLVKSVGEAEKALGQLGPTAAKAGQQAAGGMEVAARGVVGLKTEVRDTTSVLAKLAGTLAGAAWLKSFAGNVIDATNAMSGYSFGLKAALGSQTAAAAAMTFVRGEAQRLGTELQTSAQAYTALAAASRGTTLEGEGTRKIFSAVSEAARVLHLSTEATSGALNAIQQMMSKGNVQAEELRGQLGERLPGAFNLAAQAMGVTTQQLNKMLDNGQVLAADLLPKLADQLHKVYGAQAAEAANSPAAAFARLKNAVTELEAAIGNAGFMSVLAAGANGLSAALNGLVSSGTLPAIIGGVTSLAAVIGVNYLAGLVKAGIATAAANSAMAEMAAMELRAAQAAEAEAAAQLAKAQALAAAGGAAARVTAAEAALAAAQLRTAEAAAVSTAATAASTGALARFGSSALALVGGPIGALIIALGALAAATYAAIKAEQERVAAFKEGIQNLQQATQATRDLIAARAQAAGQPVALGDVVRQEASNIELLTAKTKELQAARERLREAAEENSRIIAHYGMEAASFVKAREEVARLTAELQRLRGATDDLTSTMRGRLLAFLADDLPNAARDARTALQWVFTAFKKGDVQSGVGGLMDGFSQVLTNVKARFLDADKAGVAAFDDLKAGAAKAKTELEAFGKTQTQLAEETVKAKVAALEHAKASAEEIASAKRLGEQWIKSVASLEAAKQATKHHATTTKDLREELSKLHEAEKQHDAELLKEAELSTRARQTLQGMIDDLTFEGSLIGKTNEERQKAILLRQAENALKERGSELSDVEAKGYLDEISRLSDSNAAHQRYADQVRETAQRIRGYYESMADALANALTRGGNVLRNLGRALVDTLRQIVTDMIAQWLRTRIIGMFMGPGGGGWGALASLGMAAVSGGSGGSGVGTAVNIGSSVFGGSGGSGGFSLFSPSSWLSAGKNLWQGFTQGSASAGSTIFGTWSGNGALATSPNGFGVNLPVATGGAYTPTALGYGAGILGGAYAGYNRFQQAGGGAAGVAGGLAYGIGTAGLIGGLGGLAATGSFAGGLAGGLGATAAAGAGMTGLAAAIPVVGWIALAAMLIDKFSGGKLFGTGYQTKSSTVSLGIGAEGGSASASVYQEGQKALFGGTKRRTKDVAATDDMNQAAQQLFESIRKTMTDSARALAIGVPPVIDAALRTVTEYDKKGKAKATKYFVDVLGKHYEEASQELAGTRLAAEAIVATVAASEAGKAASAIAEQWRGSAEQLMAGAQFLLAATVDIQKGKGLLGKDATLEATVAITQELAQGNEALNETYARLSVETQLYKDAMRAMGVVTAQSGADLVRAADQMTQAMGGVQQAQQAWQQFIANFGADALGVTAQLTDLQDEARRQLAGIGMDALVSLDEFKARFQAALPKLAPEDIAQWVQAGNALADATHAQEAYTAAVQQYEAFSRDLAQTVSGFVDKGNFGRQMAEIDAWRTNAIKQATDLAHAAGLAAARENDLANIELRAAQLRAQAIRELEASTRDLAARLYGGAGGSLDGINAQIAALESAQQGAIQAAQDVANESAQRYQDELAAIQRIRGYLDSLLLNAQLTTLTPEQQLAEAQRQYQAMLAMAQAGDAAALAQLPDLANTYLGLARGFYSSGDQYQAIFDGVTQALGALGARTPAPGGGGGVVAITATAELQALYERRDALLADQERETRLAMAQQLAVQLQQLAAQTGEPVLDLARSLGVKIDSFISDLGINLSDLTVQTTEQLATLAGTLGISLTDLADAVGASLGDLADQNSLINQALGDRIRQLPDTERALLEPLFNAIANATTSADANAAINALKDKANGLPAGIKDLLAPYLGLPSGTVSDIAGTKTAADSTRAATESIAAAAYWNGMSLGFQNDVQENTLLAIHSAIASSNLASGAQSYSVNAVDGGGTTAGGADLIVDALREEMAEVRAELAKLREESRRGSGAVVEAVETVAEATVTAGETAAREQRRLADRMGRS